MKTVPTICPSRYPRPSSSYCYKATCPSNCWTWTKALPWSASVNAIQRCGNPYISETYLCLNKRHLQSANKLLATYRCQVDTNRVDLRLRTVEGHQGTLIAYVTPSLPPKVSQVRRYTLRPLSMHMRVHSAGDGGVRRPYNTLLLRGAFSHAEMHNWLGQCVPELPDKMLVPQTMADGGDKRDAPNLGDGENVYYFRNVYAGTMLQCSYR